MMRSARTEFRNSMNFDDDGAAAAAADGLDNARGVGAGARVTRARCGNLLAEAGGRVRGQIFLGSCDEREFGGGCGC